MSDAIDPTFHHSTGSQGEATSITEQCIDEPVTDGGADAPPLTLEVKPSGTALLDPRGRVRVWDAAAEQITGQRSADMVGQHLSIVYPPEDLALGRPGAALAAAARHGGWEDVGWHLRGDGTRAWVSLMYTALRDSTGAVRGYAVLVRDICDPAANDGRARVLARAMVHAGEAIAQMDPDGRYVSVNAAYAAAHARTPAEMIGRTWMITVHPDDHPLAGAACQRMLDTGKGDVEVRGLDAHGNVFHKRKTLVAIRGARGALEGSFCFMKDVTDRRRAEDELRRCKELLDSSLEGMVACKAIRAPAGPDGGPGTIVDFEYQLVNAAAERLVGHPAVDLLGQRMLSIFPGNTATGLFDTYARVVTSGVPFDGEQYYEHDGLALWVHIVAVPLAGDGIAITFADVSDRKRAEADARRYTGELEAARDATIRLAAQLRVNGEQLDVARRAAEQASVAKGNFLANMSHEIRTPIAAIIGYADLLLDPTRTDGARQNDLQSIRHNGRQLLAVINDVLDLSKIEAGGMTVEQTEADLPRLAAEAASITRPSAIERKLNLRVRFDTPVPRFGHTDPLRLRQVLINLIGNAVKFTKAGTVTLRVSCQGPSDTDTIVRFDVVDTGVGMTAGELARLFQPFVQGDVSTTRKFGGTGLGLTISRQFARMLGGDITVTSVPGQGSTFTVTVGVGPVRADRMVQGVSEAGTAVVQSTEATPGAARPLAGARVLLAEDGIDNREILTAFVRGAGAEIETAEDGRRAVIAATAALDAGRPYDVILMDMQMPVLDGYAATSELRRGGYTRPIVALTAHAMSDDRAKCLAAGCDDYLTKPVDRQTLIAGIAKHAERPMVDVPPSNPPTTMPMSTAIRSQLSSDPRLADVVATFVTRLPTAVVELRTFAAQGNVSELTRAAHRLRGAGGSYGFQVVTNLAAALEDRLKAGQSVAAVAPQVDALIETLCRIDGNRAAAA